MLIKSLPSDVEDYILKYLIMPLDIETLNRVSKNVKKLVNNTKFVIEKNKITENINMLIEDDYFISVGRHSVKDTVDDHSSPPLCTPTVNHIGAYPFNLVCHRIVDEDLVS